MLSPMLLTLPNELVLRIIDFTDPSDHLNIACVCPHLQTCATKSLNHHREAHKKFSVVSDLNPSTIPTLLRSASGITNPIDAWHVRSLELWGSRWDWTEWKPWALHTNLTALASVPKRRQAFLESPVLEWSIPRWELSYYLSIIRYQLGLSEYLVNSARAEFEKGRDSVMQMLLIALCPRLQSLKYMYNKHDKVANRRSLHWLTPVIGRSWADRLWPPGLLKLGNVAVGVRSETGFDEEFDKLWYTRSCFRGFLKLPSIKSLYFRGLRQRDRPTMPSSLHWNDIGSEYENSNPWTELAFRFADKLPPRCSTIEHLYLESVGDCQDFEDLAAAPRALKSYTLHGGNVHFGSSSSVESLSEDMVKEQNQSLESMLVYNASKFEGSRCSLFQIERHGCSQLRQLYVHLDDLMDIYHEFYGGCNTVEEIWRDPKKRQGCVSYILDLFPRSLEVLMLGFASVEDAQEYGFGRQSGDSKIEELEEHLLISMVLSKTFPALKAIFLEPSEDRYQFIELVRVGQREGVDIHVQTKTQVPQHQIRLPQPPQALSHRCQEDVDHLEFDPFDGCYLRTPQLTQSDEQADGLHFDTLQNLGEGDETDDDCDGLTLNQNLLAH